MSNLERLRAAVVREGALWDGNGDINDLAIALSSRYPQSGLTIDEICGLIREVRGRVGGDHSPAP
jgi:hypothetical protein